MATSSSSAREIDLQREVRRHEVALDELNNLPSSRNVRMERKQRAFDISVEYQSRIETTLAEEVQSVAVYQKSSNLFFRTTVEKLKTSEQKQLDTAKAELQKHNR